MATKRDEIGTICSRLYYFRVNNDRAEMETNFIDVAQQTLCKYLGLKALLLTMMRGNSWRYINYIPVVSCDTQEVSY